LGGGGGGGRAQLLWFLLCVGVRRDVRELSVLFDIVFLVMIFLYSFP